jgi:hypothetical protein
MRGERRPLSRCAVLRLFWRSVEALSASRDLSDEPRGGIMAQATERVFNSVAFLERLTIR